MPAVPSNMLPLGTPAPGFTLPDAVSGQTIDLEALAGHKALLVIFLCRHCPYVQHIRDELARLERDYRPRGVGIVAISSNDAGAYPEDAPGSLREMAIESGFAFPVCYDESQAVARAYQAACTPDFFLFDEERKLVYRGRLDESRPNSGIPVTGRDLRAALDAVLQDRPVPPPQWPSLGCSIKWK